uniref:Uncharacterized protein n=1 Tax=Oryza rufipogon TaxID=4529 RepID=A0A0E0PAZ0_ORYRU
MASCGWMSHTPVEAVAAAGGKATSQRWRPPQKGRRGRRRRLPSARSSRERRPGRRGGGRWRREGDGPAAANGSGSKNLVFMCVPVFIFCVHVVFLK